MDEILGIVIALLLVGIVLFFMQSSSNNLIKAIANVKPAPTPAPEPSPQVYYDYYWPKAWGYLHPNRRLYRDPRGPWRGGAWGGRGRGGGGHHH